MDRSHNPGPGPGQDQRSDNDHSRLLGSSFNWDSSSNFTSTLDIEAIKETGHSIPGDSLFSISDPPETPLSSIADAWDQGPPVLMPHVDRSLPRLEAMDQESSSESESEECSASESESGSSSSSCSSVESESSSENDESLQHVSSKIFHIKENFQTIVRVKTRSTLRILVNCYFLYQISFLNNKP